MKSKKFTSETGSFSLTLPIMWEEYDDGEDNTYAFFNANSWSGNLRISSLSSSKPESDLVSKALSSELKENEGARELSLPGLQAVFYKKYKSDPEGELVVYHWTIGKSDRLFICTFTIEKSMEESKKNELELQTVENILLSIQVH